MGILQEHRKRSRSLLLWEMYILKSMEDKGRARIERQTDYKGKPNTDEDDKANRDVESDKRENRDEN